MVGPRLLTAAAPDTGRAAPLSTTPLATSVDLSDGLMTKREACDLLGWSLRTLNRRIAAGTIRTIKYGTTKQSPVRVIGASVRAWIDSRPRSPDPVER